MNTRLIYCNKQSAEVKNVADGSFYNNVDEGIVIKKGDEISIEQIGINSVGVGSDIIEIPSRLKKFNYKTNQNILNCMYYIHHNYQYTCELPLAQSVTKYAVPTGSNDVAVGYLEPSEFPLTLPLTTASHLGSKAPDRPANSSGSRYYLGRFVPPSVTGDFVYGYDSLQPARKAVPGPLIFQFLETNIQLGADIGFDNPSNIANSITQDFHASTVFPNQSWNEQGQTGEARLNETPSNSNPQLQCSSFNCATTSINGMPSAQTRTGATIYQCIQGVRNPFKYYYGSRLLNATITPKKSSYLGAQAVGVAVIPDDNIYWTAQPPGTGGPPITSTDFDDGYVAFTNIEFTADNMVLLAKYIQCLKTYPGNNPTYQATPADLENSKFKSQFYSALDVGRHDDSSNATTGVQNPFAPQNSGNILTQYVTTTYYDDAFYNKRFLDQQTLFNGGFIDDTATVTYNGVELNGRTLSKVLDVNIVVVNTGPTFGNNELVLGVVLRRFQSPTFAVQESAFGLVDLTYYRNSAVLVVNPDLENGQSGSHIADYTTFMNVGAPNFALIFDQTRGRFAFENMAWGNKIDSGTSQNAVPSAGLDTISSNNPGTGLFESTAYTLKPFTKYSQSGLGIRNISVIDDNNNTFEIDMYNDKDIEEKYTNCLLDRLGFEYKKVVNLFGLPDVIFTNRNYNSVIPRANANFFPYPLTTNFRFDTSISEGLSVNSHSQPMFNLSGQRGLENVNINAETAQAYATNLPRKLVFPFWLIKSDIIDGIEFNTQNSGQNKNIIAVCNRAYISGDFGYSFSTSYNFKATKEFVITGIRTSILNPDGSPADVDNGTSVIYKIQSPLPIFEQQNLIDEAKDENKKEELKKKHKDEK